MDIHTAYRGALIQLFFCSPLSVIHARSGLGSWGHVTPVTCEIIARSAGMCLFRCS